MKEKIVPNTWAAGTRLLLDLTSVGVAAFSVLGRRSLCGVCVFPYHRPLGLLLSGGGHGILNVCNDFSVCCTHGGGPDRSTCYSLVTLVSKLLNLKSCQSHRRVTLTPREDES